MLMLGDRNHSNLRAPHVGQNERFWWDGGAPNPKDGATAEKKANSGKDLQQSAPARGIRRDRIWQGLDCNQFRPGGEIIGNKAKRSLAQAVR